LFRAYYCINDNVHFNVSVTPRDLQTSRLCLVSKFQRLGLGRLKSRSRPLTSRAHPWVQVIDKSTSTTNVVVAFCSMTTVTVPAGQKNKMSAISFAREANVSLLFKTGFKLRFKTIFKQTNSQRSAAERVQMLEARPKLRPRPKILASSRRLRPEGRG